MVSQALRQAARDSQADFLSGFVPAEDTVKGPREASGASSARAILRHRSSSSDVLFGAGADAIDRPHPKGRGASADVDGISAADKAAVERWESLQRLQRQSLGLGSAAENQLGRALEVCRDIVGWQVRPQAFRSLPVSPLPPASIRRLVLPAVRLVSREGLCFFRPRRAPSGGLVELSLSP